MWRFVLAAVVALAATGAAAEEAVVRVYNWTDYIAPGLLEKFTAETGVKVVYDMYDGNETLDAKLAAGRSGYDVVFPTARPFLQRQLKAGIYQKLDKSKLPNIGNLDPRLLASLQDVDPGNQYGVPYLWGATGIGYNVEKVKEILGGDVPLDGWQLLFDPEIVAKLKGCGVTMLDEATEAVAAALAWLGRDPNSTAEADLKAAGDVLRRIRPNILYFHSSKYLGDLANGNICLAHGYSGDVLQAQARAREAGRGVEVAFIIPKQGANLATDVAAIPKDAPHPENAHRFIDFLLRPEVIAAVSNATYYANANAKATPLVDEAIREDPGVYPPSAVMDKLFSIRVQPDRERRRVERLWTQIKAGR